MKDLTQGSIVGHISAMAPQIFAGMIMMMLCGLIDLYFVSGLGDAAIAGVGAAGNAGFLINALTQVLSVGTVALISHAVGRKDQADANLVFNQSLGLSAVGGILTLIAGCMLARGYMRSVAVDDAVIEAGATYLVWFMPALALQFAMLVMASAFQAMEAHIERRAACRRRVRHHIRQHGGDLLCAAEFRRHGPGGLWHWLAPAGRHSYAGGIDGVCSRCHRRSELRRWKQ